MPNENLRTSKAGLLELAVYEGLSNTCYLCDANVKTIGLGSTKSDIPTIELWSWDRELPTQECVDIFKQSLVKYENGVKSAVKVPLTQNQFDALVCLAYNIGVGGIAKSTAVKLLNAGESLTSVAEAMKRFKYAGGKVNKGLVNRRAKEVDVFLHGKYSSDGTVAHISVNPKTHKPSYKGSINLEPYL